MAPIDTLRRTPRSRRRAPWRCSGRFLPSRTRNFQDPPPPPSPPFFSHTPGFEANRIPKGLSYALVCSYGLVGGACRGVLFFLQFLRELCLTCRPSCALVFLVRLQGWWLIVFCSSFFKSVFPPCLLATPPGIWSKPHPEGDG